MEKTVVVSDPGKVVVVDESFLPPVEYIEVPFMVNGVQMIGKDGNPLTIKVRVQ